MRYESGGVIVPVHPLKDIPANRSGLPSDVRQSECDGPALDTALAERDWTEKADRFWRHFVAVDGYDVLAAIDDCAGPVTVGKAVIDAWVKFGKGE